MHFPILHRREKKHIIITIIQYLLSYVRGFPSSKTKVYNHFSCRKETDVFLCAMVDKTNNKLLQSNFD